MKRRNFLSAAGAVAAAPPITLAQGQGQRKRALMKVGCQSVGTADDKRLLFVKRHGVDNICGEPPQPANGRFWTVEELSKARENCEQHGVKLDMIPLPFLASSHVDRTARPSIMLAQSPERDRDIEDIQKIIEGCVKVGIPAIKYNMSILGVLRSQSTTGRGGIRLSTWRLAEAKPATPLTRAGRVNADMFWERITYFLDRVIPVATQNKIRVACHPHDPGVPPEGYQGVDRVLGTVDGLKKFLTIRESPYHGLNFCQGTVSEMLQNPGEEIFGVIRYFGERKKIFNVHFRNIKGKRDNFQEVFPDEGDVNFFKAMMTYRDVGYPYMMMPDHVPQHPDDPRGLQAFAFCYGYIKALIQAVDQV